MKDKKDGTFEIFAIWEYDSSEHYVEIDINVRNDWDNAKRVQDWYESNGGCDRVFTAYIVDVKNEKIISTVEDTFHDESFKYTLYCQGVLVFRLI